VRIGILGSGLMGAKLGTLFARAGHEVVFSYARSEQKLERIARYMEPFALLVGQLAYEGEGGPELAYRLQRFAT
jgi:predicted dinucleotide-binding enzyme